MNSELPPMAHRLIPAVIAALWWCLAPAPLAAQPSPEWIRVAVSQSDPEVTLQVHGRFTMSALHTGEPIQQGRRLESVAVRAVPQGLAVGEQVVPFFGVKIEPASDAAISLNGKRLRGTIEIVRQQNLTLLVINHVALEDYLRGVLSKEAPDYWPLESLKAIAIAARTYALYQRLTKTTNAFDVSGDVMSQDYGGKTAERANTTRAVKATRGLVLTADGALFPPFYHSTCGGATEHARVMGPFNVTPLQGGVVCTACSASPFYRWQRRLTKADVGWALRQSRYGSIGPILDMQVTKRTPTGRAETITIRGRNRNVALSGYEFRALFGFERIRSPQLTIQSHGDTFFIDGAGWGHGVGLCQWGAAELSRRGLSAREILAFYYPGATLTSVSELVTTPIRVIDAGGR